MAWNWELTGGIFLTITGLAWTIFVFLINYQRTGSYEKAFLVILGLGLPFIIAGILFIVSHYKKTK
jgi:formate-dependent nitrite reductase membrane component NrfD